MKDKISIIVPALYGKIMKLIRMNTILDTHREL